MECIGHRARPCFFENRRIRSCRLRGWKWNLCLEWEGYGGIWRRRRRRRCWRLYRDDGEKAVQKLAETGLRPTEGAEMGVHRGVFYGDHWLDGGGTKDEVEPDVGAMAVKGLRCYW